jgi:2-polyprenyl-3-methyl-5-hydroxy-6-metoxy-1,4-benzoquinol methylase
MDDKHKEYYETNKESWNLRTGVHAKSDFYDLEGFKKGNTSLKYIELDGLGDVRGKSLLHLQCHFGMDTLSWEREGAIVTGVDFSDKAIKTAKSIRDELDLKAEFIECNIFDLKDHLDKKFDIVFTSYGVVGWLPNLNEWGKLIAHFTKPGGTFFIAEFHPYIWTLDDKFENIYYPYFTTKEPISEVSEGTYTDKGADISHLEHNWDHSLAETIMPLINNGFTIEDFQEYPFSLYNCFQNTKEIEPGKFILIPHGTKIPHMFSIKAKKNA